MLLGVKRAQRKECGTIQRRETPITWSPDGGCSAITPVTPVRAYKSAFAKWEAREIHHHARELTAASLRDLYQGLMTVKTGKPCPPRGHAVQAERLGSASRTASVRQLDCRMLYEVIVSGAKAADPAGHAHVSGGCGYDTCMARLATPSRNVAGVGRLQHVSQPGLGTVVSKSWTSGVPGGTPAFRAAAGGRPSATPRRQNGKAARAPHRPMASNAGLSTGFARYARMDFRRPRTSLLQPAPRASR